MFEGLFKFALFFIPSPRQFCSQMNLQEFSNFPQEKQLKNILLRVGKICKTISAQELQLPHGCTLFWLSLVSSGSSWVLGRWKAQVFTVILVCYTALQAIKICIKYGIDCSSAGDLPSITFHPYMPSCEHKPFFSQSLNDAYWDLFFRGRGVKVYFIQNKINLNGGS